MDHVAIASSEADARAAEAVEAHHAEMAGALALKVESLSAAARAGRQSDADEVRGDLVDWCRTELVPHALAEESTLYQAAAERVEARLLVEAMLAEHQVIIGLASQLARASHAVSAAELARALRVVFESHLAKENDQILPLLVSAPDVSVAELLAGMHELLGGEPADQHADHEDHEPHAAPGHACGCSEVEAAGLPELDARTIPHAIRHATIFGALDGVRAGAGLVLVAPHDPLPLLAQLEQRDPGAFDVEYLERGPEAWRLAIVRHAS
jgi:uncharacterized protein (DUF2249 family)